VTSVTSAAAVGKKGKARGSRVEAGGELAAILLPVVVEAPRSYGVRVLLRPEVWLLDSFGIALNNSDTSVRRTEVLRAAMESAAQFGNIAPT